MSNSPGKDGASRFACRFLYVHNVWLRVLFCFSLPVGARGGLRSLTVALPGDLVNVVYISYMSLDIL